MQFSACFFLLIVAIETRRSGLGSGTFFIYIFSKHYIFHMITAPSWAFYCISDVLTMCSTYSSSPMFL